MKKNHLLMMKSSLSKHLLNMKVLPTSKALKLYTTLSLTSMTNCFASMFKRKLDRCMMNRDNRLRRFNKMLTNRHWMSSVKNSYIRGKWLCMTCSNSKIWTLIFVKKNCALTRNAYSNGCILNKHRHPSHTELRIGCRLVQFSLELPYPSAKRMNWTPRATSVQWMSRKT
jgi:hypothetical protein